ncbi:hypothetical protein UA08_07815 [Talaromyces atroroseus]|uniref:C2H2-type domain-containing protein n=1 Tax=Talaromyces atroroseus TaxID=1441469 RepID=A0A225A7X0_TALAT|nr:hypothetical protein UA08_07815 [Talaromyces atroroseus]OKL56781.1 hypothetical protein UA08_07815 [Talaromyces atroroseus]
MATHDQLGLPHAAFNQQAFEDPYLSGPSDLDEFSLEQHTPSASSVDHPSRLSSRSPADSKLSSDPPNQSYGYNETSFDESKFINFDQPGLFLSDMLSGTDGRLDTALLIPDPHNIQTEGDYQGFENQRASPQLVSNAQVQSGFIPVPADATQQQPDLMSTGIPQTPQPSRLAIPDSAYNYNRSTADPHAASVPSLSPVVKISQVHRGDSPTRDDDEWAGHGSKRSSVHLSTTPGSPDEAEGVDQNHEISDPNQSFSPSRAEDGSWIRDTATGQAGLDPYARNNDFVLSPKDLEEERQRAEKDVDIRIWSASVSAANSEIGDESSPLGQPRGRPRAVSAVETRHDYFGIMQPDDSCIPGPGKLIYEPDPGSDFEASSETSRSESLDGLPPLELTIPNEPLAGQLNRSYPWKDTSQFPLPLAIKTQPESSRAAMKLYDDLTKQLETASRVGTWGSKRLNDAEVDSLLKSDSFFKNLSLNKSSILKYLPKRSSSNSKDKKRHSEKASRQSSFDTETNSHGHHKRQSSVTSKLSLTRSKTPSGTMAAAIAGAGTMAASIGSHNSLSATPSVSPRASLSPAPWNRSRSRSEGTGPVPDLKPLAISNAEQRQNPSQGLPALNGSTLYVGADGEDDDDDDSIDEKGIFMTLEPSSQQIVPTFEGFKRQISLLDPRLEPTLLNRFAHEQLRRYKKLIDEHDKHAALVQAGNCNSHERCFGCGGRAKLLPPRANAKDPKGNYCQFQVQGHEDSADEDDYDEESDKSIEVSVVPATFPKGIRLPPVKRLPAEFECTFCFKVKKFQKPSDWTKHIYEDISPFTCTFPHCNEPMSFKRKADWVRHETERHRHLEWWVCNMPKCDHKCYRKNNFVQHLVREHAKPDPTAKRAKVSAGNAAAKNSARDLEEEIDKLWLQVEECRHETSNLPEDEPCRFCGNISKNWRQLMTHLARHMEQIALPILHLAEEHHHSSTDIYRTTTTTAPPISVYSSADSNTPASSTHVSRIREPTIMDDGRGQVQPMMPYHTQQLSPSINIEVSPSSTTYPPASISYLQPHYTPAHRNSMSYPPAPSPHLMTTTQSTTISSYVPTPGASPFQLQISTIGIDGPQEPLYQSPQDTCVGLDDFLPNTYEGTSMPNYPMTASPEAEHDASNTHAYLTQIQNNTYPPTYNFQ